jgi:hypothetical protein
MAPHVPNARATMKTAIVNGNFSIVKSNARSVTFSGTFPSFFRKNLEILNQVLIEFNLKFG